MDKKEFSTPKSQIMNESFKDSGFSFLSMTPFPQDDFDNERKTAI